MNQQIVESGYSVTANNRDRIRQSFFNTGNHPETNSTYLITKNNQIGFIPVNEPGYSIRANCAPNSPYCVPNLLDGNKREKNNNTYLEPRVIFKPQQLGLLSDRYFRTPNIF